MVSHLDCLYSRLEPSVMGIHCDADQDKVVTENKWE